MAARSGGGQPTGVRTGIYIRISKADRELLDAQRQLPPCEAFVKRQGWQVVEVYTDDSISAHSGVRRENFERMLSDVRAGQLDAIVSWQMDRLLRTVEDASAIVAIARQYDVLVANVGGSIDLSTADGRKRFYESAVAAQYESDLKSERLKLKHAELAADGKWQGGPRPFGHDLEEYIVRAKKGPKVKYKLVINPEEAEAIRRAAEDVIAGRSLTSVQHEWVRAGFRRSRGGILSQQAVKELLTGPRIAGFRRVDGKLVKAAWDPIITREQHEELCRVLGVPQRHRGTGGLARKHLLVGFVFCDVCGTRLRAKREPRPTPDTMGKLRFYCDPRDGGHWCINRVAGPIEQHVVWQLLMEAPKRLLEAARRAPEEWESLGRLMSARQTEEDRLEGFADFLADGTWDRPTYLRQKKRVQARINDLDAQITHLRAQAPRRRLKGAYLGELWEEWDRLDLDEKRAVLADHIEKIMVRRVGRGRHKFHPDSIEIIWR